MPSVRPDSSSESTQSFGLSIVVPLLNELTALPQLVDNLERCDAEQIVLVDGGSTDGSLSWLQQHWQRDNHLVLTSDVGRALQMNAGATAATQAVILFLHADTHLPLDHKNEIRAHWVNRPLWGRFDVQFDCSTWSMRLIAFFINWRSRLSAVATGDQAIFVEKALFEQVGGFDDIALMEDVALCKKLKRIARPLCSRRKVVTSARRWQQAGVVKTVLLMWWFRLRFFLGASPDKLAQQYRNIRLAVTKLTPP